MIAADSITIDGDTALVVVECPPNSAPAVWEQDDKPCDTCNGSGVERRPDGEWEPPCPDCDGTGRHTFEIHPNDPEWGDEPYCAGCLRVHVLDVLPIVDCDDVPPPADFNWVEWFDDGEHLVWWGLAADPITLPSAAEPGMWLVRVKVHP